MIQKSIIFLLILIVFCGSKFLVEKYQVKPADVVLDYPKNFPKPVYDFKKNPLSVEKFELGRKLFYDPLLSKDTSISCASCHEHYASFGHIGHQISHGIYSIFGTRNVPALHNLIWADKLMWDGRLNNLENQAINPITNPIEMGENMENVVKKLKENKEYTFLFEKAFKDKTINQENLLKALAQFTGMMVSTNSKYDRFIRGDEQFTAQELNGLKVFKQFCNDCHKEPLFTDFSLRNNGLKPDTSLKDRGRALTTGLEKDNYLFRVPSLRNIEFTYPYMHDGRFRQLKTVINFYANPKNHNETSDSRIKKISAISEPEKEDLLVFLKTLTDTTFLKNPKFSDPNFNYQAIDMDDVMR